MHINPRPTILFLLIVVLLVSACGPTATKAPPDVVAVQLSWFHSNEFVGFYVADQKGYYKDANIDLKLLIGGPTVDPVAEVLANHAQFGLTAGDNMIRSRAKGDDLVAVSSIFRESPLVIISLPKSGIKRPQDLTGKTVGVISPNLDTTWDIQFLSLLKRSGVDPATLKFVPISDYHGVNELTAGKMDAMSGMFSTNEPIQAGLDKVDYSLIFYSEYGILIYSNPIFTTGKLVRDNPDLVKRFVQATLKGYQYAIEHPDEVASYSQKYDDKLNPALEAATLKSEIPLIDTGTNTFGWMEESVWKTTQDILLEQGIIPSPVNLSEVYTNQFVEQPK